MNDDEKEVNPLTNFKPKTDGQIRGMIIILRGLVCEAVAETNSNWSTNVASNSARRFLQYAASTLTLGLDYNHMESVIGNLQSAVLCYPKPKIKIALGFVWEIFADIPIPFVINEAYVPNDVPLGGVK